MWNLTKPSSATLALLSSPNRWFSNVPKGLKTNDKPELQAGNHIQSAPGKSSHPGRVLTTSVVRVAANVSGLFPNSEYLIFYLVVLLPKMSMLGQVGSTSVLSHRQHNRLGMFYVSLMGFNINSPTVQNVRSPLFKGQKHVKHTHTDKHCSEIVMLCIKPE